MNFEQRVKARAILCWLLSIAKSIYVPFWDTPIKYDVHVGQDHSQDIAIYDDKKLKKTHKQIYK